MKKNITINLFGALYAIDDDAYQLLEQYLNNMRSYFSKRDGGDEIADDIEHRVAELFSELKASGIEAISIEHVQEIIQRIGNPEQMDDEADATTSTNDEYSATPPPLPNNDAASKNKRKLYRDPQDQVLGGVMSGLCQYFGGSDPLPWRIIMVVLAVFSFSTIGIIYLIAWALIPAAYTAEERLQMKGQPVNPQTLSDEIMKGASQASNYVQSAGFKNGARSFARTLLNIFVFCLKLFLLFIIGSLIIAMIVGLILFIVASHEEPQADNLATFIHSSPTLFWYSILSFVSGFACLSILLYGSLRALLKSNHTKPLSSATTITLVIIALLSAASATTFGTMAGISFKEARKEWRIKSQYKNGIFIDNASQNKLAIDGYQITQADNCNDDGCYYTFNDDFEEGNDRLTYYFEKEDDYRPMNIGFERTENLPAGKYRIECVTAIDGPGMFLYWGKDACMSLNSRNNQRKGNYYLMSYNEAMKTGIFPDTLSEPWWLCYQREEASAWSYQQTDTFIHKGGPLTYAIRGTQDAGAEKVFIMRLRAVKVDE